MFNLIVSDVSYSFQTPCLQYLDIRNTVWTEQALPLLGRSIRLDCCLTVLHMECANLSGRPLFLLGMSNTCNFIVYVVDAVSICSSIKSLAELSCGCFALLTNNLVEGVSGIKP